MKRVVVESPYAGDSAMAVARNIRYARRALQDSLMRGEAPFASHLLYTQDGVLDDGVPVERRLGLAAGEAWRAAAELSAFYVDLGWSRGMLAAKERCFVLGLPWEERHVPRRWAEESWQDLNGDRPPFVQLLDGRYVRQGLPNPPGFRVEKLVIPTDATAATMEALRECGYTPVEELSAEEAAALMVGLDGPRFEVAFTTEPSDEVDYSGCLAVGVAGHHSEEYGEPHGLCRWCGQQNQKNQRKG